MQYSAVAILALAASASAAYSNETAVAYTTEVVTNYVTYCPVATTLTYGHVTYTASESETVTIPGTYTVVKPVYSTSAVYCNSCKPTYTPVAYPTANATTVKPVPTTYPAGTAAPTIAPTATPSPSPITSSGASKFALSGASLAGLVGIAAFLL